MPRVARSAFAAYVRVLTRPRVTAMAAAAYYLFMESAVAVRTRHKFSLWPRALASMYYPFAPEIKADASSIHGNPSS